MRLLLIVGMWVGTAVAQTTLTESVIDVNSPPRFVAFAPDSQSLITASTDGVQSWSVATGDPIQIEARTLGPLEAFPDGVVRAVLQAGELATGEVLYEPPQGEGVLHGPAGAFSRDGSLLGIGFAPTRQLSVWDTETGRLRFAVDSGLGAPTDLEFSPDGRLLAATYQDTNIYVWSVSEGRLLHVIDELDLSSFALEFSADGAQLISGGADQIVRVWDTRTWNLVRQFETRQPEAISDLHLSADGRVLLTSGIDVASVLNPSHVVLWDVASGTEVARIRLSRAAPSVALSPDGRTIAAAEADEPRIRLWTVGN